MSKIDLEKDYKYIKYYEDDELNRAFLGILHGSILEYIKKLKSQYWVFCDNQWYSYEENTWKKLDIVSMTALYVEVISPLPGKVRDKLFALYKNSGKFTNEEIIARQKNYAKAIKKIEKVTPRIFKMRYAEHFENQFVLRTNK